MLIDLLPGAEADLMGLESTDPDALATVIAFLEEAEADDSLIDKFTSHGNFDLSTYRANAKGWVLARRGRNNLYRIRVLGTPATSYRIVYGYDWRQRRIGVLAVLHKDEFDYGLNSEIAERIVVDWRNATGGQDT
jgi:mRNA-degrading endonuclease RelE of RelBE toxin-antitoxin system